VVNEGGKDNEAFKFPLNSAISFGHSQFWYVRGRAASGRGGGNPHFRCYIISQQTPRPATSVTLKDQFLEDVTLTIDEPLQFCAPTSKNGLEIEEPEEHLTMYGAAANLSPI